MTWGDGDFVVGVDLGGTKIDVATADGDSEVLAATRLETDADKGVSHALERALVAARTAVAETAGARDGVCRAAGFVSPGIVHDNRIHLAPNLPGLESLPLADVLADGLGVPAVVDNDVRAGAFAEACNGILRDTDPAVFINLGTGLAAGLVVGGRVLTGAHGAAGEIGYSLLGSGGREALADGRAPLEEIASGGAIGARASGLLGRPTTAAEAFAHTDGPVGALVDDALDELAVYVANLTILLDPARIALAGGLTGSATRVLEALRRRIARAAPFPPEIMVARFAKHAGLRGALALALARAGAPRWVVPGVQLETRTR